MACSKPVLPEKFQPNKGFQFPSRSFGKTTRSFRPEWCITFPWLHYNTEKDAAFCHLCMTTEHEGKFHGSMRRDPAFIARGYTYWKEATAAFRKHQASDCHKQATELVVITRQVDQDVGELLSAAHQQEKKTNRAMF